MILKSYDYFPLGNKPYYYFESEGEQGNIPKIILFSPIETESNNDAWNLAFGDLKGGDIDDSVISNNHDIVKVIGTIGKVVYEFSEKFPLRSIIIVPVDDKRKILYNHVFRRNHEEISLIFNIIGTLNKVDEEYSAKKIYDSFKLKRKFVQ